MTILYYSLYSCKNKDKLALELYVNNANKC